MKRLTWGLLASAALALPAPAAPAPDVRVGARPALWVVQDEDTTIWLFGTVHLLRPDMGWFNAAVARAFESSEELRMEVVLPEDVAALAQHVLELARDPQGRPLTSKMNDGQRKIFLAAAQRLGLPVEQLEPFKPWFVSLQLAQLVAAASGLDPASGAEAVLTQSAKAAGKPVTAFETPEEQMAFIDGTPESEQIDGLIEVLGDPAGAVSTVSELVDSWAAGDPERTGELLQEETRNAEQTRRILLTDRNHRWAQYIVQRLATPGTVFVAVGAGHLAGPQSVQEQLAEQGVQVRRVVY
ncbi:MAG: TraB/GumN family protein [Steroidobacteraceae bacterium]